MNDKPKLRNHHAAVGGGGDAPQLGRPDGGHPIGAHEVQNRMTAFGVDAIWLSHEPWLVPELVTPEAGEMYSKEDIACWIDVRAHVAEEARTDPDLVRTAPHDQAIHRPAGWQPRPPRDAGDDLARRLQETRAARNCRPCLPQAR
jgi:hypothetical protein